MFLAPRSLVSMMAVRAGSAALAVLLMVVAIGVSRPAGAADPGDRPLSVFTTVVPLATFVERIGGDQVRVQALVRPGQNPHAYEPSPRQVAALADADLYVRVGMSLEDAWLPRIRATNARMRVLDARDNIRLRPRDAAPVIDDSRGQADHGPDHDGRTSDQDQEPTHADHEHEAMDNHVWTSPPLVKSMGAGIRDALIALRPDQADVFRANYDRFAADLDALDAEIRVRLAPVKDRRFMVFHPAWGYFAETYGLTQVAVEYEGKEPGGRALAGLIDAARANAVTVVLVQPQFSPRAAEQIAAAIGGRVESVDPLAADYFATLRRLTDLIAGPATP